MSSKVSKAMNEDFSTKDREGEKICSWCGTPFGQEWPQSRPVCQRCLRLLTDAGIKDEEIFGEDRPGKGGGRAEG
jgi:hypothetical protein